MILAYLCTRPIIYWPWWSPSFILSMITMAYSELFDIKERPALASKRNFSCCWSLLQKIWICVRLSKPWLWHLLILDLHSSHASHKVSFYQWENTTIMVFASIKFLYGKNLLKNFSSSVFQSIMVWGGWSRYYYISFSIKEWRDNRMNTTF